MDGSTGTNGLEQAKVFNEKFGLTGLVVTKLDGSSKAGAGRDLSGVDFPLLLDW